MESICIVSNLAPPIIKGGYELLAIAFAEYMAQRGARVDLLTTEAGALEESTSLSEHGVRIHRILRPNAPWDQPPTYDTFQKAEAALWNTHQSRQFFEETQPERVFFWNLNRIGLGPLQVAREMGIPCAMSINDYYPLQYVEKRPMYQLFKQPIGLSWGSLDDIPTTYISRYLAEDLARKGFRPKQQHIIYQGIDLSRFPEKSGSWSVQQPLRLLYVGTLSHDKGVDTLVEALALLPKDKVRCTFVGAGEPSWVDELQQKASKLGLDQVITWAGKRPHADIPQILAQHDALVFPSRWPEPFGLSQLEALASGLHVISTSVGGLREMFELGVCPQHFDAGKADQLAKRIKNLFHPSPEIMEQARQATVRTRLRFSFRRYLHELEDFLERHVVPKKKDEAVESSFPIHDPLQKPQGVRLWSPSNLSF
ncbi:MAG: glycosyltransferase family 4 protein [Myxococcales bacterium]|nr:glycosyltransferase family 4 protein [Myxococcales bacterium]MCB9642596.1 glycosyltransferase family 4 protein [Myxococcales bacterium]